MKPTARKLDIVLRSAAGLKKVNTSRMAAYAVAWIEPSLRVPSPKDKRHGRNPVWDTTITMTLDERTLSQAGKRLHIELLGQGWVSTKPIGFVSVDMTDILLQGSEGAAVRAPFHEYPVRRRSGRQQGILNFELCLQASSTHVPSTVSQEEFVEDTAESVPNSAPTLPQYQQGSSMQPQQYEMQGSHDFSRKSTMPRLRESKDMGYGFAMPTSRRAYDVAEHDEISLLDSYDSAPAASHFR
ncbi:hypothetical protein M758_10G162100 [Ceratodon purpureus]|nr:hypothetical protein M758_10G162100 [Ceratodon purpureus]